MSQKETLSKNPLPAGEEQKERGMKKTTPFPVRVSSLEYLLCLTTSHHNQASPLLEQKDCGDDKRVRKVPSGSTFEQSDFMDINFAVRSQLVHSSWTFFP